MTVQQCTQGFRTAQILKEFGIKDEFDEGVMGEEVDEDENNNDNEKEEFGPRLNHHKKPLEDHDIFNDSRQHLTINSPEKNYKEKK